MMLEVDSDLNSSHDVDVLVVGGGIAGLWALAALCSAGYGALLVEMGALGMGQTIRSQGIVHSGGKYLLQGVKDTEAARTLAGMPARWLASLEGRARPDLSAAVVRSRVCHLWVPRRPLGGELLSKAPELLARGEELPAIADALPASQWPEVLKGSAFDVRVMEELVVDVGSVLAALQERYHEHVLGSTNVTLELHKGEVSLDGIRLHPRAIVLAAGAGNEALLEQVGATSGQMQRRPLTMSLLRGSLPELYGHCVVEGKTHLTVTSVRSRNGKVIWQIGGEVAERTSSATDLAAARADAIADVRRFLPDVDLAGAEVASYSAIRTEAATGGGRRPSGSHVERVHDQPVVLAVWPTKLALAPLLADQVVARLATAVRATGALPLNQLSESGVRVADPPWERAAWFPVP